MAVRHVNLEAGPWWRQALADFTAAGLVYIGKSYFATSWFAQQSVEKGTKALIVERRGTLPPRTHDLNYLGRAVSVPQPIAEELSTLNPSFQRTRYPDYQSGSAPVDQVTANEAKRDLDSAKRVLIWLAHELGEQFPQS